MESLRETLLIESVLRRFMPDIRKVVKRAKRDPDYRLFRRFFRKHEKKLRTIGYETYGSYHEDGDVFSAHLFQPTTSTATTSNYLNATTGTSLTLTRMLATIDIDGTSYIDIPKTELPQFQEVRNKPGYVQINSSKRIMEKLIPKEKKKYSLKEKKKYSSREKRNYQKMLLLSDNIFSCFKFNDFMSVKLIKHVNMSGKGPNARFINSILSEIFSTSITCNSRARPAIFGAEVTYHIKGNSDFQYKLNYAFMLRVHWWPEIARQWTTRSRNWPTAGFVEQISRYVYIKPSSQHKHFKYSFVHVEKILARLRNDEQKLNFFVLKVLFYKYVKPISKEYMRSYFIKTIMLWTCERFPPNDSAWKVSATNDSSVLRHMLRELLSAFQQRFLPNYFLPDVNVLRHLPERMQRETVSRLSDILQVENVLSLIKLHEIKHVQGILKNILNNSHTILNFMNQTLEGGILGLFTKRPNLFSELTEIAMEKKIRQSSVYFKICIVLFIAATPILLYIGVIQKVLSFKIPTF